MGAQDHAIPPHKRQPDNARAAVARTAIVHLLLARAVRDFGDGFISVLLPVYLTALGFSPFGVGVIATAALLGSALLTLAIGLIGARYDHRHLLLAAATVMIATGCAFAVVHDYALLLVVAFAGTINPSAGSVSVFVPLEHALLTREASDRERTKIFSRYSLVGALASASGALAAAAPDLAHAIGIDLFAAIKLMFVLYTLLGVMGACIYVREFPPRPAATSQRKTAPLGPSRHIVYRLAALFSLDAFAGGFVVQSLLVSSLRRGSLRFSSASLFFMVGSAFSASFPSAAAVTPHRTRQHGHGVRPASRVGTVCLILAAISPVPRWTLNASSDARAARLRADGRAARSSSVMAVVAEDGEPAGTAVSRRFPAASLRCNVRRWRARCFRRSRWPLIICGALEIPRSAAAHPIPASEAAGGRRGDRRTRRNEEDRSVTAHRSIMFVPRPDDQLVRPGLR